MSDDTQLEKTFAQMRGSDLAPSDALLERVMMDADAVLATPLRVGSQPTVWASLLQMIGGWPSFGGLAAATVAGVWIGVSTPDALSDISAGFLGTTIEVSLFDGDTFVGLDG